MAFLLNILHLLHFRFLTAVEKLLFCCCFYFFSLIGLDPVLHTPSYPTAGRLQRFSKLLAVFDGRQTVSSGKHYGPALRCPNQLALDATMSSSPGRFPQMHFILWTTFLHTNPFTVSWRTGRSTSRDLMPSSVTLHSVLILG